MSNRTPLSERAKYNYLLQLSTEQIKAIDCGDMQGFDRILVAKGAIIQSLADVAPLLASDPTLPGVIAQIKANEVAAQDHLQARMREVKDKLGQVAAKRTARNAYRRFTPFTEAGYDFRKDKSIPRFIDSAY
jgi:hypothetical protein